MTPGHSTSDATEQLTPIVPPVETSKKTTRKSSGFSVVRLEKRVTATFSIMAKVFVIIIITLALLFIARELSKTGYVITQVNVPASFEEAGYTGPVMAKRISENLSRIITQTRTEAIAEGYTLDAEENDVAVDMVGMGVPVRAVVELMGDALGIRRKNKITADITLEGNKVVLVVKVGKDLPERIETPMDADIGIAVKALVAEASEAIFKYTNDRILGLYLANVLTAHEKVINLSRFQLEKYHNDPKKCAAAYARWGSALANMKKLDLAEAKLKQALALDSTTSSIYTSLANFYFVSHDYKKALKSSLKSLRLMPEDAPNFQRCTGLTNVGYYFSYNDQSDSAMAYYNNALEVDPKYDLTYYNISYEYLIKGDTSACLDNVEKALTLGLSVKMLQADPDMEALLNHPRLKEMLLKYDE